MNKNDHITEEYIEQISTSAPYYLKELERETYLKIGKPHMITGFTQGRFLSLLSKLVQPDRILEIGTFTGYGSLCLAEGLSENGIIHTLECSEENVWLAEKYINSSPFSKKIKIHIGNALTLISQLNETWDIVYIDADKANNLNYVKAVWDSVRVGGMVLVDNVFARGAVLKPEAERKPFENAISYFNQTISGILPDATVTILPIRDGLSLIRKEQLTILPVL